MNGPGHLLIPTFSPIWRSGATGALCNEIGYFVHSDKREGGSNSFPTNIICQYIVMKKKSPFKKVIFQIFINFKDPRHLHSIHYAAAKLM